MSSKVKMQESFLNSLKEKFEGEVGVDVILWELSYSYMTLIHMKFIQTLNEEMESDIFKWLVGFGFKKNFKIKY